MIQWDASEEEFAQEIVATTKQIFWMGANLLPTVGYRPDRALSRRTDGA